MLCCGERVGFICKKGSPTNNIWMGKDDSGSTQLKLILVNLPWSEVFVALQAFKIDMYGNLT